MMQSINRFAPHKTALTAAIVVAVSSLIFVVPMAIMVNYVPMTDAQGNTIESQFPAVMFLLMPIFYLIFGYIFTVISAWIYNIVSKFTGGIKIELK